MLCSFQFYSSKMLEVRENVVKVKYLCVSEICYLNVSVSLLVNAEYLCKSTTMVSAGHESLTPPVACGAVTCDSSEVPSGASLQYSL